VEQVFDGIARFYDGLVERFGHDPRACDYGHANSQRIKFQVLAEATDYAGLAVLDVGCGFADFADFLEGRFAGGRTWTCAWRTWRRCRPTGSTTW
jgi:ubiquinone/menaquinone biosynthesis C-methylase UbiE